ncbi:tryptophan transporter [Clostridioides sp. ZZV15-6388]|uniref:tryptophan transporter n=1 Tax=unclassified Clostridioides TaxID=2635829 RepID=UPI001D110DF7|nr:tryptophan transporter [Clostridioides sp. ZZV15-6388]MCC0664489.1 tryptophan transporter [Clostridioides sp. ZZV15-6597]MCC0666952.1 tryptophan transporter [Clostridioides sp. ZZV14-6153]
MKTNTKKLTLNAILLAMGLLIHQLTPAIGLPMQPDISLAMMFIIMILNKDDYKICLVAGIVTGIFAALTTKFPGGQIPNIFDKTITINIMFMIMYIIYKLPFMKRLSSKKQDLIAATIIFPVGTVISGTLFLLIAQAIVGLPGASFTALFMVAVAPAILINLIAGMLLFKVVSMSIRRVSYQG